MHSKAMKPPRHRLPLYILVLPIAVLMLAAGMIVEANGLKAEAPETITVTGVLHVDRGYEDGSSVARTAYVVVDEEGNGWSLDVSPEDATPLEGATVEATGEKTSDDTIRVSSFSLVEEAPEHAGSHRAGSFAFATILCRFADNAAEPQPVSFFDTMMGNASPGANHYWQEVSYGAMDLDGSIQRNWVALPEDRSEYVDDDDDDNQGANLTKLFNDCKAAHEGAGADFSGFFGINLIFNDDLDCCAWGGSRSGFAVTWMPPWSWSDNDIGGLSHGVLAQEMGHSFGLPHEGCFGTESPYDSNWDPMSSARFSQVHVNAAYKDFLHWIGDRKYVANDTQNQVVRLERLAQPDPDNDDDPLMAQINVVSILQNPIIYYTVEARKFAGYDTSPSTIPSEGVVIHFVNLLADDKNATVVHYDPVGDDCNNFGAWQVGQTFIDEANGVRIGVLDEDDSGFTISINGPVTDLEVTKTAPLNAVAGELMDYHVSVVNHGPDTATGVEVEDVLPAGVSYVADTDSCVEAPAGTLTCTAPGPLFVGDSWDFVIKVQIDPGLVASAGGAATTITNTVEVTSDIPDLDFTNNTAALTTFVVEEADLRVTKECKPDQPNTQPAGTSTFCDIYVDNLGPSHARNVSLVDQIISSTPVTVTGISVSSTAPPGGTCSPFTPIGPATSITITCTDSVLPAGARNTIRVTFTASNGGDVDNTATVSSDTPDPNTSNNIAVGRVTFEGQADLRLTKTGTPDPVLAGETLTYQINVTNLGPSTATNVVVEDNLPAEVTNVSWSSLGNSCNIGVPGDPLQPLRCNLGSISNGATETITIVVTVKQDTPDGTVIFNQARVFSDTADPNNGNNAHSEATTVNAQADLQVEKTSSPDPVKAGDPLNHTITITNNGPSQAQNVSLTDALPPEVSYVGATITAGSGTCVLNPLLATVTCDFNGGLDAGSSWVVVIEVLVDPSVPDGTTITNTATVSSSTSDPAAANDSDSVDTEVVAEADLVIVADSNFETGNPSTNLIFVVTVTNDGPSDAQNVVVVDELPVDPKKVEFVFDTGDGACTYDATAHELTCDIGTLAAGESWEVQIHVKTKGNLGTITNTATVSSDTFDPNLDNNTDSKDALVQGGSGGGGGPKPGRGRP